MSPSRLWLLASAFLLSVLLEPAAFAAAPGPAAPAAATAGPRQTLILAATVDDRAVDEPIVVERVGDRIWLRTADLPSLGLSGAGGGDALVALSSLRGVSAAIDDVHQAIAIVRTGLPPTRLTIGPRAPPAADADRNGWGGFVNYDATAFRDGRTTTVGGALDATVFTPHGYGYADAVASVTGGRARLRRGDTGYTIDVPGRLLSATAGDFVNAASSVSRPVRLAGLRVGTDFSLRPDLVTFPLPTVSATAAVPTAVDVIVNGDRQTAGDVRGGRFAVADVPVQTGVNSVSVEVRDALGRPTLQTVSTYTSRALLRPGLSAWSAEAGWVRTGYLTPADRYRDLAASGTWRRGLSGRLTVEAHGEAVGSTAAGGIGAAWGLGRFGMVDAALSVSRDGPRARIGSQIAIGFERVARPITISARFTRSSADWSDIANRYGSPTRRSTGILNIGFDLARLGTLSGGVIALGEGTTRYGYDGRPLARQAPPLAASTLVNATYSVRLTDRLGLVVNAAVDTRRRGSSYLSAGALVVFGRRTSGFAGATMQDGHAGFAANVSQSPVEQGQWGFRAAAASGLVDRAGAAIGYLGRAGYVEAVVDHVAGHASGQLTARGSIGFADGRGFAGNTMTGSFAVIETAGQPNVPIYQNNRRIGQTDGHGRLVAPNLVAYEPAKFSIDPLDVDAERSIDRTEAHIRPARRAGVTVRFDLASDRARSFVLVDQDRRPLAPGGRATVAGVDLPVGIGGLLYAAPASRSTSVMVHRADGTRCIVDLPAADTAKAGAFGTPITLVCRRVTIADADTPLPAYLERRP